MFIVSPGSQENEANEAGCLLQVWVQPESHSHKVYTILGGKKSVDCSLVTEFLLNVFEGQVLLTKLS